MGPEPRSRADQGQPGANPPGEEPGARPEPKVKSFEIGKRLIVEAWEKVRANNGAPGVDAVGIGVFQERLRDNLFKLWNKMSSGSYFPGPVRGVEIPKDHGEGVRLLGVPNTGDRVAQTAAAMLLEEKLEPVFHRDSYGYRPGRSAHDALAVCRRRCWAQDWVLDLDVRAFFDSVPHSLLLKAVAHHTSERWVLLYISRWLKAPMQMPDGTIVPREKGTPQGSPISPLLANLFMHYAFDMWMDREFPGCQFERYADLCRRRHKSALGYTVNRSRLVLWNIRAPGRTTRARRESSWPGSAPMRTAWTTWSGCAGLAGLHARRVVTPAAGGWAMAGMSAAAAGGAPR